jgi:hypothetical protein
VTRNEIDDAYTAAALALRNAESSGLNIPNAIGVTAILRRWAYRVTNDGPVREYRVDDVRTLCASRGLALADAE